MRLDPASRARAGEPGVARAMAQSARAIRDALTASLGAETADAVAQTLVAWTVATRFDGVRAEGDFYEPFLAAYDPRLRARRGVYFTPRPLAGYVVRCVAQVLEDAFGILPDDPESEYTVLDPACGTGRFLIELITVARARFIERGDPAGWREFVRTSLLPRLAGCELLRAPYTIAHLNVLLTLRGADLAEPARTAYGYELGSGERVRLSLANALDEWQAGTDLGAPGDLLVVVGNPPYAGHSANANGSYGGRLLRDYAPNAGESNLKWLHDDYVKFIRFAEDRVERAGRGIVAFVTNHAYLDNPTFAGMRRHLMRTFDEIYVLDLHGNAKIVETAPDGTRDENVFDIRPGVAIGIFVKRSPARTDRCAVRFAELYGNRQTKYGWLDAASLRSTPWAALAPDARTASFRPARTGAPLGYADAPSLASAMPVSSLGVLTKRDALAVAFTRPELLDRLRSFADPRRSDEDVAAAFGLPLRDKDRWDVAAARRAAASADAARVRRIQYRCGDFRCYYDADGIVARRNRRVLDNVTGADRFAFLVGRQGGAATSGRWDSVWATAASCDQNLFRRGGATVFPVLLRGESGPRWNFSPEFLAYVRSRAGEPDDDALAEHAAGYVYGLLNAPRFAAEFADELKRDFPRLPIVDAVSFRALSEIGWRLLRLHLLEDVAPAVAFAGAGDDVVGPGRPALSGMDAAGYGNVVVNAAGRRFEHVHRHAWERTCGGSPVLASYLRARRGRALGRDDVLGFTTLATALDLERGAQAQADAVLSSMLAAGPRTKKGGIPERA